MARRSMGLFFVLAIAAVLHLGCGGSDEETQLGFDTAALAELGIESVLVQAFLPEDATGEPVTCEVLLEDPANTSELNQAGSSLLEDIDLAASSMVLVMPELPPGETWFLVLGFSGASGGGQVVAAGCGKANIERGVKASVVVRMEPVE